MTIVLLVDTDSGRLAELSATLQAQQVHVIDSIDPSALSHRDLSDVDCIVCNADHLTDIAADKLGTCVLIDYQCNARWAVVAMKAGVRDYLVAPFSTQELVAAIDDPNGSAAGDQGPLNMVGTSQPMATLYELIRRVGPTKSAILIQGESGTGKELVARALHSASRRNQAPFIAMNCATTPDQLIESELFGYPGAKPGSERSSRGGLLQAANGGTLFLDAISELPAQVQARLQSVLETGTVRELPTGDAHHVDVRLITATHRNLKQLIDNDLFSESFYYRINVVNLTIPPLRERGDDVLKIAEKFLKQTSRKLGRTCSSLSGSARQAMLTYDWPGNVRELENAIERAVILCNDSVIDETLLAIDLSTSSPELSPANTVDQTSLEDYFVSFVTTHQDQLTETELAQKLGISRKSLWERRQRLNIPRKRTKKRGTLRDSA